MPLSWNPMLPAIAALAIASAAMAAVYFSARGVVKRFGTSRAMPLVIARGVVFLLVLLSLLDPSCRRVGDDLSKRRVVALVDHSGSMATPDCVSGETRFDCGRRIVESLRASLPASVGIETLPFSDAVLDPDAMESAPSGRTSLYAAFGYAVDADGDSPVVLLVTDGGEAPAKIPRLPRAQLAIFGTGSDLTHCDNISVTSLDAPDTVEQDTNFKVKANVAATGSTVFMSRLGAARALFEMREADGRWTELDASEFDLSGGAAEVEFEASRPVPGEVAYRVRIESADGEVSVLDNVRAAQVDVRRELMNVLYFSCRLGADLKMLRQELSSDPSIAFTAAYRVGGARFAVQGDDPERAKMLEEGLPASSEALGRFDAIILGSFPADAFEPAQEMALLEYVENGGGVIWLGGEESFEGGGYGGSRLEVLFPWKVAGNAGTLRRGEFQLAIPPSVAGEDAVAGLGELLDECRKNGAPLFAESVNAVNSLKTSAQPLVEVETEAGRAPMAAMIRVGSGRSIAVASNTTWRWGRRPGRESEFYRRFWRQFVRAAAGGNGEGDDSGDPVESGTEPLQGEGYSLLRRDSDLRALAARADGAYFPCEESGRLVATIRSWCVGRRRETRMPLATTGPWFALVLLATLVAEWSLRRFRGIV